MKKYRKPIIREIILDTETEFLIASDEKVLFNTGVQTTGETQQMYSDQEDLSKEGYGWDTW